MIVTRGHVVTWAAVCLLFFGSLLAGGAAPTADSVECPTTNPIDDFPHSLASVLKIAIGEDTIETTRQKLGESKSVQISESAGSVLCYWTGGPKDRAYLVFEFGPLGGFSSVTGYRISRTVNKPIEPSCAPIHKAGPIEIGDGLHLGMTKAQFKKAVGGKACERPESVQFTFAGKRKMNEEEFARFSKGDPGVSENPYFDLRAGVAARFGSSGVTELYVYKTESY
jgi:hypothetical protein